VTDQETTSWSPAFPSQRRPFQPGNEVGLRHGAHSARRIAPLAEEILQSVLDDPQCQYLTAPRFAAELEAWAANEGRVRLLEAYIGDGVGDLADEATRSAWALLHRCETRAQSGRDRLGLSPASASKIGRDLAMMQAPRTIEDLKRAGRELLAELDRATDPDDQEIGAAP
jgi:hypothetical protein